MVLQVPNKPNHNDIGRSLQTIFQHWPDVKETSVAHVFGEQYDAEIRQLFRALYRASAGSGR